MKLRRLSLRFLAILLLALLAASGAHPALEIVWGPVLGDLTANSVRIAWYTNVPSNGAVLIGDQELAPGGVKATP